MDAGQDHVQPATIATDEGTFTINQAGEWSFDVNSAAVQSLGAGESLTKTFEVKSADGTATQTVTVTIDGSNDAATITGTASGHAAEDNGSVSGTLTTSDVDAGQDHVQPATIATDEGTFTINQAGEWSFDVNSAAVQSLGAGESLTKTFEVKSADGTATQTVTVTIDGSNDGPVVSGNVSLTSGTEDRSVTIKASDLLGNASDMDGDTLSVSGLTANHGTLTDNGDGTFTFTPEANYSGGVELSYTVSDGHGGTTAGSASFELAADADAPVLAASNITVDLGAGQAQTMTGTANADTMSGGGGNDVINGGAGNDVIYGDGTGTVTVPLNISDRLSDTDGSESLSSVTISGLPAGATLSAGTQNADGSWTLSSDQLSGLTVTSTEGTNLHLTVSAGSVEGSNGDTATSTTSFDVTFTGTAVGNDTLDGGTGSDLLDGGAGNDVLNFSTDGSWSGGFVAKNVGDLQHGGTNETFALNGSNQSQDVFRGGAGTDTIVMGSGNDSLFLDDGYSASPTGGARIDGVESINAGDGNDVVDLTSNRYAVGDTAIDGGSGNDVLMASQGNDVIDGGTGNDYLYGASGNDTLRGGEGADTLNGGWGNDVIDGGVGNDTGVFVAGQGGADVYDGGAGTDSFKVQLTSAQYTPAVHAELQQFEAFIANPANPGQNFHFNTLGVDAKNWESVKVVVDGREVNLENAPTITNAPSSTTDEDHAKSATITAADVDPGDTVTYSLVDAAGNHVSSLTTEHGTVSLNASTGEYTFTPNADAQHMGVGASVTDSFKVVATDDHGVSSAASTVGVTITGANDGPSVTLTGGSGTEDHVAAGQVVGTDMDTGDTLGYHVEGGVSDGHGNELLTTDHGVVSLNTATGEYTFTPADHWAGDDSFSVTVSDGNGGSVTQSVAVHVDPAADQASLSLSIGAGTVTPGGSFTVTNLDATASAGYHNTYGYYVMDDNGNPVSGEVIWKDVHDTNGQSVTISGVDPDRVGFFIIPDGDQNLSIRDGSDIHFAKDSSGNWQVLSENNTLLSGTGAKVLFDNPALNSDRLVHSEDSSSVSGNQNWEDLNGGGDRDYNDVNLSVNWNAAEPTSTHPISLAANFPDMDGSEAHTVTISGLPAGAVLSQDGHALTPGADGGYTIDPTHLSGLSVTTPAGFTGTLALDVAAKSVDGSSIASSTAHAQVSLDLGNDGPEAGAAASVSGSAGFSVSGTIQATDPDGNQLDFSLATGNDGAQHGSVVLMPDGSFVYTPTGNYAGSDSFKVLISDGHGGTSTETVNVGMVNGAPTLSVGDLDAANDHSAVTGHAIGSDPNIGDSVSYALVDSAGNHVTSLSTDHGTVTINASTGDYTFTPNAGAASLGAGASAHDSFQVVATDSHGASSSASTVDVSISGSNDGPTVTTTVNATASDHAGLTTGHVTATDTDSNDAGLVSYHIQGGAAGAPGFETLTTDHGTVTLNTVTGDYTFSPNAGAASMGAGATATDAFTVRVCDGHGGSTSAQVGVSITGTNDGPTIATAVNATASDHAGLTTGHVTATDTDSNDAGLVSYHIQGGAAGAPGFETLTTSHGTVSLNTVTGDYTFSPNEGAASMGAGATATDAFTVRVSDGHGGSTSAQVGVSITGTNDGPTVTSTVNATASDHAGLTTGHVTATDADSNDAGLVGYHIQGGAAGAPGFETLTTSYGTVTLNTATGDYTFSPNAAAASMAKGATATDAFTVTVSDGHGGSTSAQVGVNLTGTNDAPIMTSITGGTGLESTTSAATVVTGKINASDVDADTLSYQVVAGGSHNGTLSVDSSGNYTFTANNKDWHGSDSFTVAVSDGQGGSFNQTVNISVAEQADSATITAPDATLASQSATVKTMTSTSFAGGAGSDTIVGTSGADTIIGDSTTGVKVNLNISATAISGESVQSITLSNIPGGATLDNSAHDLVQNDDGSWTLTPSQLAGLSITSANGIGGAIDIDVTTVDGSDTSSTHGSLNVSFSGGFNDTMTGGLGADTMDGGAGNDVFKVSGASEGTGDTYIGGSGNDTILGSSGNDVFTVTNNLGNMQSIESLNGGGGTDTILASSGNDYLNFSGMALTSGANRIALIDTGAGNDTIIVSNAADSIVTGTGDDTVVAIGGKTAGDVYDAGAGGTDTLQINLDPSQYTVDVRREMMAFAENPTQPFTFQSLGGLKVSNFEQFRVTVGGEEVNLNNPPEVRDVTATYSDNKVDGAIVGVDSDGDTLTYGFGFNGDGSPITSMTTAHGTVTIEADTGKYHFTASDPDYKGGDTFSVTVKDSLGGTASKQVSIDFNPGDDATVITGHVTLETGTEDTQVFIRADQLLSNATDVDNKLHVENLEARDANGNLAGTFIAVTDAEGHEGFAFNPNANVSGDITLSYNVVTDDPTAPQMKADTATLHLDSVADKATGVDVAFQVTGATVDHLGTVSSANLTGGQVVVHAMQNSTNSSRSTTFQVQISNADHTQWTTLNTSTGASSGTVKGGYAYQDVSFNLSAAQNDLLLNGADLRVVDSGSRSLKLDYITVDGQKVEAESLRLDSDAASTVQSTSATNSTFITLNAATKNVPTAGNAVFSFDNYIVHDSPNQTLHLSGALADTDGSENLVFHIDNLPTGVTISASNESLTEGTLTSDGAGGYYFTTDSDYNGSVDLNVTVGANAQSGEVHVTALTTEIDNGDQAQVMDTYDFVTSNAPGAVAGVTLSGNRGDDILRGSDGNDLLLGGKGGASHYYSGGSHGGRCGDLRSADTNDSISGGAGDDIIFGDAYINRSGQVLVTGNGNDVLDGGIGSDQIHGGGGNDTIIGGAGDDQLWGDAGSDLFIFGPNFGHDVVDGGYGTKWTDTIDLTSDTSAVSVNVEAAGWAVTVDATGHHVAQAIDPKAHDGSGTIVVTNNDGSQDVIEFHNVEKVTW
ncbi:hypothetical protein A6A04_20325 [Paramagnetospirillum marisnigri]|uniref:Cadherin domain-containing protein n=1 Tax=Paramagnetospirillum marisnigri TaxID=1285242 RepID=A0A178MHI6_9PROT|nr:hypothetical protein A6A04_20325 [Paramagnetospirillum marisnigri]